jgi:hypothetical protein
MPRSGCGGRGRRPCLGSGGHDRFLRCGKVEDEQARVPVARNDSIPGARSSSHSKASRVIPNACISARASNGFSRAPCISPRSNRPESSSDCCAAAAAAGSAAKSTSATTNPTAAWIKASTEVTHATLTAWHERTPVRGLAASPISLICGEWAAIRPSAAALLFCVSCACDRAWGRSGLADSVCGGAVGWQRALRRG